MLSPGEQQLTALHFRLFEQAYADAYRLAVGNSQTIREYAKVLHASASGREFGAPESETLNSVTSPTTKYYLFGDFHTLWNTQQAFLKLVADARASSPSQVAIALEAFRSEDQTAIDLYLRDEICELEFLETTQFEQNWGFPWHYYKAIIDFGRYHGIPVYGVSPNRAENGSLQRRDAFSAKIIQNIQKRHGGPVCCLIGELHLGDTFLPYYLSQESRQDCVRILTNQDELFFDATHRNILLKPGFTRLGPHLYHLTNATPWYKWQTFRLWQDFQCSQSQSILEPNYFELECGSLIEEYFDIDDFVHNLIGSLNHTFGTSVNSRPEVRVAKPSRRRFPKSSYRFHHETRLIEISRITIDEMIEVASQAYVFGLSSTPINPRDIKALSQAEALAKVITKILNPPQLINSVEIHQAPLNKDLILAQDLAQPLADRFIKRLTTDPDQIGYLQSTLQKLAGEGTKSLAFLQDLGTPPTWDLAS